MAGVLVALGYLIACRFYLKGDSQVGSLPIFSAPRSRGKKKPMVQDDLKAWNQEQKEPREIS
jgi:hypothetical protein